VEGQLGLFRPTSDWEPPAALPDLRGAPLVAVDLETRDQGLATDRGAGWAFGPGGGHVAGVAYAAAGHRGYAPVRHPETACLDEEQVRAWLGALFASGTPVVFHNAPYDLGWCHWWGLPPPVGEVHDTSCMAVMLDENRTGDRPYSLDAVARWQGVPGKDEELLRAAAEAFGTDPKGGLWRLPARYVGPYAEQDADSTLQLAWQMLPQLRAQGVEEAYRTEMALVPCVVQMRARGIRLDVSRAEQLISEFYARRDEVLAELSRQVVIGRALSVDDVRSPQVLAKLFSAEGVQFPRTGKTGQGSFTADWMWEHSHWLPQAVSKIKLLHDAGEKFVQGFLLDFAHRGRLHAEMHQFKSDDGGTRSHRFAVSNPPLQQMPSPDGGKRGFASGGLSKEVGVAIRKCFLPEPGEVWASLDYSQQEPRLTVHFAAVCRARGADAAVARYVDDPRTDYHTMVAEMTGRPRPVAKILNLSMTYGKGKRALAEELGVTVQEAEAILNDYHGRLPFIKSLEDTCKSRAAARGYIRLLDGARIHYDKWEGGWTSPEERSNLQSAGYRLDPCDLEEARRRQAQEGHPWAGQRLRRADVRKALNNLIQGSAARQTKIAMLRTYQAGYVPLLQIHDELALSLSGREQVEQVAEIMRTAVDLRVPMVVDAEVGRSWGEAKTPYAEWAW